MNLKENFVLSLAIIGIFSLFLFIIFGDNGLAELKLMKNSRDSLIKKNQELIQKNLSLYRTIERLRDDFGFIENVARQELGVIGKNEIIFKLIIHEKKGLEQ